MRRVRVVFPDVVEEAAPLVEVGTWVEAMLVRLELGSRAGNVSLRGLAESGGVG